MSILDKVMAKLSGAQSGDLPKVEHSSDQPQDQIDLAAHIKNKVQEVRNSGSRTSQEGIWMTNYAYLMGYDSVYYDTNTRQYRINGRAGVGLRRDRLHVNKVLPVCQRRSARICKNPPKWEIRPDNSSEEAKDTARLEKNVLEFYIEKERVMQKRQEMMMGLMQCGHYYLGVSWNDEKGELLQAPRSPMEGAIDLDEGLATEEAAIEPSQPLDSVETEPDYEFEGDIQIDVVSPFEMFFDPLATTVPDAKWCIRAKVRKLDYFKSRWPERGPAVKEEGAWLMSVQNELRIQSLTGQGPSQTGVQSQMKDCAIELAYYETRSKKHPEGRLVIMANDIILEDKALPKGLIPFVKFDDVPITDKFYPEAIVTHLRPVQDQYNKLITKRAQWTNLMLVGKWKAPRGAQLSQEAINDQSGEVVYYENVPGAIQGVEAVQVPVIPQYAYTEEDKLNAMFYDIAGEGEISRGILPAAGIPAIGMQLLLEQDETRISSVTSQHEYAFAELYKLMLIYLEEFVTNERLLKIADPYDQFIVKKWKGEQLKSSHDVIVTRGSTAPTTLATKRNDIMNMYNLGALGTPGTPEALQRMVQQMEFGDVNQVWEDQSVDKAQIRQDIEKIELGKVPEVNEFDNHALHLQEKNRYRKSDKFKLLDPTRQGVLMANMEMHLQELMKITAPQFGLSPNPDTDVQQADTDINRAAGSMAEEQLQSMNSARAPIEQET